jgi:hypothetical protein
VGLTATRHRADAARGSSRTLLVGALLVVGAFVAAAPVVAAAPATAGTARLGQAPGEVSGEVPPAVVDAQHTLAQATDTLAAWEAANGADPAAQVADLDAQLAELQAQRVEATSIDERARLEFAIAALTGARSDAAAAQAEHDALVAAQRAARDGVVAAKLAAPGPQWSPTAMATAVATSERERPVRDDTWVVMALVAALALLAVLVVAALRHRWWHRQLAAWEGARIGRSRDRRPMALEERVDVPIERLPRIRAWARGREVP